MAKTHLPFQQNIADLPGLFAGYGAGVNPLEAGGLKQIIGNESLAARYKQHILSLVSEESYHDCIENVFDQSLQVVQDDQRERLHGDP